MQAYTFRHRMFLLLTAMSVLLTRPVNAEGSWETNAESAKAAFARGDLDEAESKWHAALKQADGSRDIDPGVVTCLCNLALVTNKLGKASEAERLYELAMRNMEGVVGPNSPRFADLMFDLAWLYEGHRKLDKAEVLFKRAIQIKESSYGKDDEHVASSLDDYARFLRKENRGAEATELEERARNIRGKINP